jgi:uncharacterized membrane protein YdbT with pleckstrin-like domain
MVDIYVAPKEKKRKKRKTTKSAIAGKVVKSIKSVKNQVGELFTAYVARPTDVRFETQEKDEKIVLLLRRHQISNFLWIFLAILMVFAPLVIRLFPFLNFLPARYRTMTLFLWYLFIFAYVLENYLCWYFGVNIITDERIVDIDFFSLIYKEVSHCKIDQIQDITFRMGGLLRTIFNFGDVVIQTAGEVPFFELSSVPNPALVVQKLNELITEEEQEKLNGRVR